MIRFPKMHIAQSVVNRILNVANDIDSTKQRTPPSLPALPDVGTQGTKLDQALETPPAATSPPDGAEPAMLDAAIAGDSPMDAAVSQGIANDGNIA